METRKSYSDADLFAEDVDVFSKVYEYFWAVFGIVSLVIVLVTGAWWHLLTVGVCASLYLTARNDNRKTERHGR